MKYMYTGFCILLLFSDDKMIICSAIISLGLCLISSEIENLINNKGEHK